ncbi:MAG: tetratricopeptide repeat protein [Archangium sp.]
MNWLAVIVFAFLGIALARWFRENERKRVKNGDWSRATAMEVATVLWREYFRGVVEPELLHRATKLPPPRFFRGLVINQLINLDVAAGRYREALEWRGRWNWKKRRFGFDDDVLRLNEAEALACLGRLDEALSWAPADASRSGYSLLIAGLAAHRAWVLAELGRVDEARRELTAWAPWAGALAVYEAEWHLSSFAVELAAKNFDAAEAALVSAERIAQRESSKRNVHFSRGRLFCARGAFAEALPHFERGAASAYRWQGGAALLDWGDALQQLGRVGEAREAWQRCVERDGQSPHAATARDRLQQFVA